MAETPEQRAKRLAQLKPFEKGDPRINRKGRKKGVRNWSTIVQNLLGDEELLDSIMSGKKMPDYVDKLENKNAAHIIITTIMIKAIQGDMKAADWLRKTGFGDKLDVTSLGERVETTPVIISEIKPRAEAETETELDNRDTEQQA